MEIVLLKAVDRLGGEGQVVDVKPGYARNYLLPQGLAVQATAHHLRMLNEAKQRVDHKAAREKDRAEALKRKIEGRSVTLKLTLGEGDKPFGSISTHDVVEALTQDGLPIEKHAVQLDQPIKGLGIYEVPVRLHPEVTATLKLWVVKA